jgi:hypothetical protein
LRGFLQHRGKSPRAGPAGKLKKIQGGSPVWRQGMEKRSGKFTGLIPCTFGAISRGGVLTKSGTSCYIKKVPRVQLSLPVLSSNVILPEDLFRLQGMPR